eukprot:IDg12887t1
MSHFLTKNGSDSCRVERREIAGRATGSECNCKTPTATRRKMKHDGRELSEGRAGLICRSACTTLVTLKKLALTTVRLPQLAHSDAAAISEVFRDGCATFDSIALPEYVSDNALFCSTVAETAAILVIGCIKSIKPVHIKVALLKEDAPSKLIFSRTSSVSYFKLHINARIVAIRNISPLNAEVRLPTDPIIVDRPFLDHLRIDTKNPWRNAQRY